ncbi:5-(carboxyamino)imidazole ribonucleotide synthase [Patescibacteria group bacterium]|nr:5-(carboxyamino)imidazole ribonucleotide synthase [Patescibacteria group bacterium]
MRTLGIVGGGQLARMLTDAAHGLGLRVVVLDPTPESPGGQVADMQIVGSFTDPDMIRALAAQSDVITFETESADNETLQSVSATKPVHPSPQMLSVIKDKFAQKQFLAAHGIPTSEFSEITTPESAEAFGRLHGYPFVLKAKRDSYDGRGNALISDADSIPAAFEKLGNRAVYAERFVPFTKELAVVAVRSTTGEVALFPIVETVHKNHICDTVTMPAPVDSSTVEEAEALARKTLNALPGVGVCAIEMFLADRVLVNEIAPRVHNSGHLTIEACESSQFEQHVRAVMEMPLGSTKMKVPAAVMLNILGTRNGPAEPKGFDELQHEPGTYVHLYGKHESRIGRKMAHITVTADTVEEARAKADALRDRVSI